MNYQTLKLIHIVAAILTSVGFAARALLSINKPIYLSYKSIKVLPHIIDTILLASGATMVFLAKLYPTSHSWLAIKLILVCLYIAGGFYVLKRAESTYQKLIGFVFCLLVLGYIVGFAYFKTPYFLC